VTAAIAAVVFYTRAALLAVVVAVIVAACLAAVASAAVANELGICCGYCSIYRGDHCGI